MLGKEVIFPLNVMNSWKSVIVFSYVFIDFCSVLTSYYTCSEIFENVLAKNVKFTQAFP